MEALALTRIGNVRTSIKTDGLGRGHGVSGEPPTRQAELRPKVCVEPTFSALRLTAARMFN
jgi:hypothetical protein